MKKFVKCKKTSGENYTENEWYELIHSKGVDKEIHIIVRTNFLTQLVIGVKDVREDFFKEHFYTDSELRKVKIKKLLDGEETAKM